MLGNYVWLLSIRKNCPSGRIAGRYRGVFSIEKLCAPKWKSRPIPTPGRDLSNLSSPSPVMNVAIDCGSRLLSISLLLVVEAAALRVIGGMIFLAAIIVAFFYLISFMLGKKRNSGLQNLMHYNV